MDSGLSDFSIDTAQSVRLLKAMGNAYRLRILTLINAGEITVSELAAIVGLSQSALSQHLIVLRKQGVVSTRRDAQKIYYYITSRSAKAMLRTLESLDLVAEHGREGN